MEKFFLWLVECFKAIPSDAVTGLFLSLILFVVSRMIRKINSARVRIRAFFEKINEIWKYQLEINDEYKVIPSPQYNFQKRKIKNDTFTYSNNEIFIVGLLLLFGAVWLCNNYELVQTFFIHVALYLYYRVQGLFYYQHL